MTKDDRRKLDPTDDEDSAELLNTVDLDISGGSAGSKSMTNQGGGQGGSGPVDDETPQRPPANQNLS